MTRPSRSRSRSGIAVLVLAFLVVGVGVAVAAGFGRVGGPDRPSPSSNASDAIAGRSDGGAGGSPAPSAGDPSASAAPSSAPPSSSPSATPTPAPSGGVDPAKFGYAAKRLRGEVFAFVTWDQVPDAVTKLDYEATSTIVFFSLQAGANGEIQNGTTLRAWRDAATDELIARAHAAGTKVVFAMSRFSWSPSQTQNSVKMLDREAARARLAKGIADEVVARGVDGVNVDFEPIPRGQKAHFTDLIRRIRAELDARRPGYQLTFDVVGHFDSYDVGGALRAGADAVYLMGYHYAGTFSTIAHGTAPLGGPRYSVGDAIAGLRKVAKPAQIIVGVPYYGHIWPTTSGARNARTTGGGGDVPYRQARVLARAHPPSFDPGEAVQWSAWRVRDCATCPLHWVQLYYDDARSLGVKWAEFRRQQLLGTGFWTWGFQGDSGELAAALRAAWLVGPG